MGHAGAEAESERATVRRGVMILAATSNTQIVDLYLPAELGHFVALEVDALHGSERRDRSDTCGRGTTLTKS